MDNIEKYQKQLLEQTQNLYRETPISEATARAYLATPRHCFVIRYREWGAKEWHAVNPGSLAEHIATVYANRPLILFGEDDQNVPSTISQPHSCSECSTFCNSRREIRSLNWELAADGAPL
jgi:hypothetical protein